MQLEPRRQNEVAIIKLHGRFDSYETPKLREWFNQQAAAGLNQIVVNMEGVPFIDSSGLAALVQEMKRARERGGDLHLCTLQQPARIIFELTRIDRAINIFGGEDEAVAAFV
jgi:anti-sigma B factor antagonist